MSNYLLRTKLHQTVRKIILAVLLLGSLLTASAQDASTQMSNDLVELAKIYRDFHFRNTPPAQVYQQLESYQSTALESSATVIAELITTNNQLATKAFLTKPDLQTMKYLYIIRGLSWNLREAEPRDNKEVIEQLSSEETSPQELLSCYYGMLFTSIGNKNQPLNMAEVNFNLREYGLEDDSEKGIFFLKSMDLFGMMIWGYMNVVKPPNHKAALAVIRNYPTYNGQPYYQYQDLNFPDFDLTLDKRKPKESFKKYYINKYMNTLLYHSLCLSQKKKDKVERENILLGSILKNESYYQFSENAEVLRKTFKKVKE